MARTRNRVIDRDRGWKELKRRLPKAKGAHVSIGIHNREGSERKKSGDPTTGSKVPTLLEVAWWNEFGTFTGAGKVHVPERSYIRSTHDKKVRIVKKMIRKFHDRILQGKMTVHKALSIIGHYIEKEVKQKIVDIRKPPNAPSTIKQKGSSNPLIDTGQLHQGITHVVNMKPLRAK